MAAIAAAINAAPTDMSHLAEGPLKEVCSFPANPYLGHRRRADLRMRADELDEARRVLAEARHADAGRGERGLRVGGVVRGGMDEVVDGGRGDAHQTVDAGDVFDDELGDAARERDADDCAPA